MLTDPQSSYWQEKFDFIFCAIKSCVFAALAVEAILTFLIAIRMRAAWAVMLNRVTLAADRVGCLWSKFHG